MAMYLEPMSVEATCVIIYKFINALIYVFTGLDIFANSTLSLCLSPHLGCHQYWEEVSDLRVYLSSVGNRPEILSRVYIGGGICDLK